MKKYSSLFLFFLFIGLGSAFATHNRAGEITYIQISGFTYRIRITTYTKESSTAADKCALSIFFGDGDSAVFSRINGPMGQLCGPGIGDGESIGNDTKKIFMKEFILIQARVVYMLLQWKILTVITVFAIFQAQLINHSF